MDGQRQRQGTVADSVLTGRCGKELALPLPQLGRTNHKQPLTPWHSGGLQHPVTRLSLLKRLARVWPASSPAKCGSTEINRSKSSTLRHRVSGMRLQRALKTLFAPISFNDSNIPLRFCSQTRHTHNDASIFWCYLHELQQSRPLARTKRLDPRSCLQLSLSSHWLRTSISTS